jgi:hypothetical protein
MRFAKHQPPGGEPGRGFDFDFVGPFDCSSVAAAVAVRQGVGWVIKDLLIGACNVGKVIRLAPTQVLIVAEVRKWPAKKCGS